MKILYIYIYKSTKVVYSIVGLRFYILHLLLYAVACKIKTCDLAYFPTIYRLCLKQQGNGYPFGVY